MGQVLSQTGTWVEVKIAQGQLANFTLYNVDVINCPLTSWASSHNKNVRGLLGKAHAGTAGQDSVSYQGILILSF